MTEENRQPQDPYRSIRDLPKFAEMLRQLDGLGILTTFFMRDQRPEVKRLRAQLDEMVRAVDGFYEVLGPRNWIFHESLQTEVGAEIASMAPDVAEARLIKVYESPSLLDTMISQTRQVPALKPRQELIARAKRDFEAERYYSTVLLLITVMDGFVNDLEPKDRRGLHARDADEMVAWNSIIGHHLGLTRAHQTFKKGFYKTSDEEVFELYRNGIVHGTLTNFDNVVVAAKAWNRLFAVVDWAKSVENAAKPPEVEPTLGELLKQIQEIGREKLAIQAWKPRRLSAGDPEFDQEPVYRGAAAFLQAWQERNYGAMAARLARNSIEYDESIGKAAVHLRSNYALLELDRFDVTQLDFVAPVICEVKAKLAIGEETRSAWLRCIREDDTGEPTLDDDAGDWRVMSWGPAAFFDRRDDDA